MKPFHYIDENHKEQLDLIRLFESVFDNKISYNDVVIALEELEKHIKIIKK